jgi:cyclopropane-fatty-acyl-phospholipid synthase
MELLIRSLFQTLQITSEFKVVSPRVFDRFEKGGDVSLILGEAYMAGEWQSDDLAAFFRKVMTVANYNTHVYSTIRSHPVSSLKLVMNVAVHDLRAQLSEAFQNDQTVELSKRVGEQHYDIPDILYEHMLDPHRQYTCGYWKSATTLEEAQRYKMKLLIDKLQIPEHAEMKILDIGCGWGGLAHAISERYPKCAVVGISISKEQIAYAKERYLRPGLQYLLCDYRDLPLGPYDRIISVGMFEHVGVKNYGTFFRCCERQLAPNGVFVLHTITTLHQPTYITGANKYKTNAWLEKYVFPGGHAPTAELVLASVHQQGLMYHHIQNLSISYAKTLNAWHANFKASWPKLQAANPFFTPAFYNMWEFYLLSCMVLFEKKRLQLSQFVLTKQSYPHMYVFSE